MAIAFVVEDGSGLPNATSYVSVEEADDMASLNIHDTAWPALTIEQKQRLLMYASKTLDARTKWNGSRTTLTQSLDWPRTGMKDESGNTLNQLSVPYNLRMAVVEFARWSASSDRISVDTPDQVIGDVKVDSISIHFTDAANVAKKAYQTPEIVGDLLRSFGKLRDHVQKVLFGRVIV